MILDSGTTTYEIARLMRQHSDVIAMTNGMNVANALLEADGVELLMTGGHLRRQSQSFYGDQAEQSLQNYHFDMLFLGVDAIDLERGVSTHNEDEARLNRRMCEVAERIIVVTDSSKFNRSSLHKIIDTQRIHTIIVDEGIPEESLKEFHRSGVEVIIVQAAS
ncbi:DNA-binding transcriptional dual regulator (fragment) [uncultured Citrobacter sp.]|uniref:DNA-binding transcriptional dual regulator n=1 Tax=uncultured Citrobacter sp. TaxID=200446 RepID=A0A212I4L7_9ENTR